MKLQNVVLRRLEMAMREPFETSFGVEHDKDVILVQVNTVQGAVGYAECTASTAPLYSEETNATAWHMLNDFLLPTLQTQPLDIQTVDDLRAASRLLQPFKGNRMAKAAVEMALWDAFANETKTPLHQLLGGTRSEIPVGISVGIQPTIAHLVEKVRGYVGQGYQRIKVKVRPGYDVQPLAALREAFPDIQLMADANSAYRLSDLAHLKQFDAFGLMMIEQPLAHDDIVDHARLQAELQTAICLDESIHSAEDVRKAAALGACRIVNLKVGRVGGFAEAMSIHDACVALDLELWCGGMLETGIGRLHNIALTSKSGFTLPGDTAPSARYFSEDIIAPAVEFSRPGWLAVEDLCGVQQRVDVSRVEKYTVAQVTRQMNDGNAHIL